MNPKPRALIYARFSSDMQRPESIADQIRLCERLCHEHGWEVGEVIDDAAMSGASRVRPGFRRLLALVDSGHFDYVVAESFDRLSRDPEDGARLFKQTRFRRVTIVTRAEGEIDSIRAGIGATLSAIYVEQLGQKTHRGLEGRVLEGKSAGGLS